MKKLEKNQALALRRRGESYKNISKELGVSKGTLSLWFKDEAWSSKIKTKLTNQANKDSRDRLYILNNARSIRLADDYKRAEKEATQAFNSLKNKKLFITAISLYWGEGDRIFDNGIVRISNVDAKMLKVFKLFLQELCKVDQEKIRGGLLIYPDLNNEKCLKFWSKEVNIKSDRFFKSTIINGKSKPRTAGNGVCIISVHDKYLKKKILTWLELFKKEF